MVAVIVVALVVIIGAVVALLRVVPGLKQTVIPQDTTIIASSQAASDGSYDYFYSAEQNGIVRASTSGSGASLIYLLPDDPNLSASGGINLSLDGDRLYFSLHYSRSMSPETGLADDYDEVHCIRTDGSGDSVIFTSYAGAYDNDDPNDSKATYLHEVAAHNGTVYVITLTSYGEYGPNGHSKQYQLISMAPDGSNQQNLALVKNMEACEIVLTPSKLYYVTGSYGYDEAPVYNQVYEENLDGTEFRRVYTGTNGDLSNPVPADGRLYLRESGDGGDRILSVGIPTANQNGGSQKAEPDVTTLFEPESGSVSVLGLREGALYVGYNGAVLGVGLADGELSRICQPGALEGLGQPCLAGDHFVLLGGSSESSDGLGAAMMGLDGQVSSY